MILNPVSAKCTTLHILVVARHPQDQLHKNVTQFTQVNETIRTNGVIWKFHIYICIITMNSGLQKRNNYIMFYKCVRELVWLIDRLQGSNHVEFFLKTYKDSYFGFKEAILWETCLIISTKLIELDKK